MRHRSVNRPETAQAGYSLIELLVVLAILVLLATLTVPQVIKYLDRAKVDAARVEIGNLGATLDIFRLDVGRYPSQNEGLEALLKQPDGAAGWSGPYLKRKDMLFDPWDRPYRYKIPGQHGEYDLSTFGADNAEGGDGASKDVANW